MAIMFKVGSRYESDQEAGISHFLEHMFFKGSAHYGGAKEIAEAIEGVGGVLNAGTDKELTMYWARVPKNKAKLAIDVLGDMLFQPLLDPIELEKERLVVLEELKMYQDSPQEYVHSLFEQISWPNHPLGRDVGGTEASVRALTRSDLLRYLDEHYLLRNLVVTIAGPVTHEEAIGLIEPYLKARGNGSAPPSFLPSVGNGLKPTVLLKSKKTEQAHVCLGVHAPSYMDRDRHVIDILNCVLGEGMSSRLFLEVREKLGLAYDVHSYVNKMYDTGVLGVYAGTEPRQAARAVGAIVGSSRPAPASGKRSPPRSSPGSGSATKSPGARPVRPCLAADARRADRCPPGHVSPFRAQGHGPGGWAAARRTGPTTVPAAMMGWRAQALP